MLCHASRVRDFAIPLFKKPFPYWNNLNSAMLIVDGFLFVISQTSALTLSTS